VQRSSAIGVSTPSTKLIEVRPGKLIVARSTDLSTRRNFVLLAHLSSISAKQKGATFLKGVEARCELCMNVVAA
jgi:hypothetical protein